MGRAGRGSGYGSIKMSINLNNYEAYFLDYHEGKLAPEQVAGLMSFLEEHPELKEMFYEFENISLTEIEEFGHDIKFEAKSNLKKEVSITKDEIDDLMAGAVDGVLGEKEKRTLDELLSADPKVKHDLDLYRKTIITADHSEVFEGKAGLKRYVVINAENYSKYLSAAIDNELNALEREELERFLLANPAMQSELELLRKTKLSPDLSIVYENKEELKRKKRGGMVWWYIPAAAASIIIILGLFFLFNKPADNGVIVADDNTENNITPKKDGIVSPVEKVKKNANSSETLAATDATTPAKERMATPRKPRKGIINEPSQEKDQNNTPMQDDLRDLQAPAVANNNDLPKDPAHADEYMASNDNSEEINENPYAEEPDEMPAKPVAMGYNSLREAAIGRIKTKVMKDEADVHAEPTQISKWDVVSLALRGFRKVTGKSTEMEKVYDEQGEVVAYNINIGGLEFSRNK